MENPVRAWEAFLTETSSSLPSRYVWGWAHVVKSGGYSKWHSHPHLEIVYHRRGRGSTSVKNGEAIDFEEGGVVIYAPEEPHNQQMKGRGEDVCVHLDIPADRRTNLRGGIYVGEVENPVVIKEIESLAAGTPVEGNRLAYDLRASSVLVALVEAACSRSKQDVAPGEKRVRQAEEYVREKFREIETLAEVAEHVGISHDRLRHLFQIHRGKSLIRYLNETRVARARSLLSHSRMEIKEVADACGFRDVYYFSNVFRLLAKCPPAQYRVRVLAKRGKV